MPIYHKFKRDAMEENAIVLFKIDEFLKISYYGRDLYNCSV